MLSQLVSLAYGWHSAMHWLLGVAAIAAIGRGVWVWLGKGARRPIDRALLWAFAALMTIQGVLGLVVLIGYAALGAGWPLARVLHAVLTVIAIVVGFQFMRWDDAEDKTRARNSVLVVASALVCTFVGILMLPGGIARMMPV